MAHALIRLPRFSLAPGRGIDRRMGRRKNAAALKLIIVHYHLRPGGIRRIIELATPHLVRAYDGRLRKVVLACGEAGHRKWNRYFVSRLRPLPVEFFVEPAFNYFSEQRLAPAALARKTRTALDRLLADSAAGNCLVWGHNLAIGRNLRLTRELVRACAERNLALALHHHDWWFDNRWLRWPEMRRSGFRTLRAVAQAVLPGAANVRHIGINHADVSILRRHFPVGAGWLPNLTEPAALPPPSRRRGARAWLRARLGRGDAPVWLVPCRLLRRKNVAEALLLTRWLRPEAWLVVTGDVSSADERPYAARLEAAARRQRWRLRLGILRGDETGKPSVAELLAVSEVVLLTSVQEGFGLPYLEATAARRPLIARRLPNIAPDLHRFGFQFPQYYDEILVAPELFNWRAEVKRQTRFFRAWRKKLPRQCRCLAGRPALLARAGDPQPIPFSRLTLTAQLEVLAHPARESWSVCAPLNPFLAQWRELSGRGGLRVAPWPREAAGWLSGGAYARRFQEVLGDAAARAPGAAAGIAAQEDFMRQRLGSANLFPLLWARES